jgi:hypothetical protein
MFLSRNALSFAFGAKGEEEAIASCTVQDQQELHREKRMYPAEPAMLDPAALGSRTVDLSLT